MEVVGCMKKIHFYVKSNHFIVDLFHMGSNYLIFAAINGCFQGHGS
jgi:hypothetical protein